MPLTILELLAALQLLQNVTPKDAFFQRDLAVLPRRSRSLTKFWETGQLPLSPSSLYDMLPTVKDPALSFGLDECESVSSKREYITSSIQKIRRD